MTETKSKEKITVIDLPITALRAFEEHPYKVVDNEEMASLVDSIYNQGILTPITVRPLANGLLYRRGGRKRDGARDQGLSPRPRGQHRRAPRHPQSQRRVYRLNKKFPTDLLLVLKDSF